MNNTSTVFFYWFMLFGFSLFSVQLGNSPLMLSDAVALGILVAGLWTQRRLPISTPAKLASAFIFCVIGVQLFLSFGSHVWFSPAQSLGSSLRLLIMLSLLWVLPGLLQATLPRDLAAALRWTLWAHSLALLIQVLHYYYQNPPIEAPLPADGNLYLLTFDQKYLTQRFSGLFAEPAWLGWYYLLCLSALASLSRFLEEVQVRWFDLLPILLPFFFAKSLVVSGGIVVGLLLLLWVALSLRLEKSALFRPAINRTHVLALAALTASIGVGLVFHIKNDPYWSNRFHKVLYGSAVSVRDRFPGKPGSRRTCFSSFSSHGSGLRGQLKCSRVFSSPTQT